MVDNNHLLFKTVKATKITFATTVARAVIQLAAQLVLLRIIMPEAFGVLTFSQMLVGFFSLFATFQGRRIIIKEKTNTHLIIDVAFTLELILGIVMTAVLILSVPILANLVHKPEIILYTKLLALTLLLEPFFIAQVVFERKLDFFRSNIPVVVEVLVNAAISILLVLLGFGILSIIYGLIIGKIVAISVLWMMLPYRPKLCFDKRMSTQVVRFGLPLTLSGIVAYLYSNVDNFMIGKLLGNKELGYYWFAFNIPHLLLAMHTNIGTVIFPAFSNIENDAQLKRAFEMVTKLSAIFFLFPCAMAFAQGRLMIEYFFGKNWIPALVPFQIIMVVVAIRGMIISHWTDFYMGKGKSAVFLYVSLFYFILIITFGYLAIKLKYGIIGMACVVLFTIACSIPLAKSTTRLFLKYSYFKIIWPQIIAFFIVLICGILLRGVASRSIIQFIFCAILIFCFYILSIFILDKATFFWTKNALFLTITNKSYTNSKLQL